VYYAITIAAKLRMIALFARTIRNFLYVDAILAMHWNSRRKKSSFFLFKRNLVKKMKIIHFLFL